jgi:uncharacterized protein involved in exopolysaccharide biosynthesis
MNETLDRAISVGEIFRAIRRYWWIPCATLVLFCTIAVTLILVTTPVYRAEALVKAARPMNMAGASSLLAQMGGGLASLVGFGDSTDDLTAEALAVMKSRKFVIHFIEQNNLMPVLFSDSWDAAQKDWIPGLKQKPTALDGYKYFVDNVFDAFKDRKSGFVKVQIDWTDRKVAALWANQIIVMVNDEMRAKATQETNETIEYLDREHQKTDSVAVRAAIFSMMESQLKSKTMAAVRTQYAFDVIDPAIAPDEKTVLRPRKLLYLAAAIMLGGVFGMLGAVMANSRRLSANKSMHLGVSQTA